MYIRHAPFSLEADDAVINREETIDVIIWQCLKRRDLLLHRTVMFSEFGKVRMLRLTILTVPSFIVEYDALQDRRKIQMSHDMIL